MRPKDQQVRPAVCVEFSFIGRANQVANESTPIAAAKKKVQRFPITVCARVRVLVRLDGRVFSCQCRPHQFGTIDDSFCLPCWAISRIAVAVSFILVESAHSPRAGAPLGEKEMES